MAVNHSVDARPHKFRYVIYMTTAVSPGHSPVLRILRIGLHVMFALLLLLGLVRTFLPANGVPAPPIHHRLFIVFLVVVLALVYVLGTSREYRRYRQDSGATGDVSATPAAAATNTLVWGWLIVITALWLTLLFLSPAFVWVAFPLMFLYLALAGKVSGVVVVVLLWVAAWVVPWWDTVRATGPQSPDIATILGPGIGAVLAVLVSAAYRHLLGQAAHHQRVAAALRAAQTDLAITEHRAGQLEERERLAREIHDTLAQGFSSIVLLARAAGQHELPAPTRRALETIEETAVANLSEARELVRHLATADSHVSLGTELERLTARYETELAVRNQPLQTSLRWEGDSPATLSEPVRAAVLRTVQVGLGNVAAHARARHAVITIGIWPNELTVDIFDDGVGFDVPHTFRPGFTQAPHNAQDQHTGYGLYGLEQRLTALKGSLTVESTPGEGTVLAARIPLTSQSNRSAQEATP